MMPAYLVEFQTLFRSVRDTAGPGWGAEILLPWLDDNREALDELHDLGRPESHRERIPGDRGYYTRLEGLYALSRVIDLLVSPLQPVNDDPALLTATPDEKWWTGRPASPDAWRPFGEALGGTWIAEDRFHPFFHEIVEVQPAEDPDEPPSLVSEYWPGLLAGSLLLVRSGVAIRAGANVVDPEVGGRSCLYWAWWRRYRPVRDRSHGWGGNSQWGTDFRRDYTVDGMLHYNVDWWGLAPDASTRLDQTPADRELLLRYRCGLTVDFGDDQFPYQESLIEPR
jgi:hypothetical protein